MRDRETNLTGSNIRVYVDGRAREFSYSAATDTLTHRSATLAPGSHTVKVVAKDAQGLTANKSWSFRVAR